ncbi:hypothetical protein ACFXTO_036904 [Malus domestica]
MLNCNFLWLLVAEKRSINGRLRLRLLHYRYGSKEAFIDLIVRDVLFGDNLHLYDSCVDDATWQTETC